MDPSSTSMPYVEVIPSAYGWIWVDASGFGHRGPEYQARWTALGGAPSGWDRATDGSFTSQLPLGVHGYPIDPRLPAPVIQALATAEMAVESRTNEVMLAGAALAALYLLTRDK